MKLKNKKFFIIALFFCIILSFSTLSKANFTFDYEGEHYDVPNLPADNNNYHLFVKFSNSLMLFTSSEPITYLDSSKYSGYGEVYGINGILYRLTDTWLLDTNFGNDFWRSNSNNKKYFVYSNYDIVDKNSGELVFQKAPLTQMVTPMEVGKVEELPTLIIQIVEMIIPAFLIIFGTLLVLYLIKSKNLLQL